MLSRKAGFLTKLLDVLMRSKEACPSLLVMKYSSLMVILFYAFLPSLFKSFFYVLLGIDFHIGLPTSEQHTVSRLTYPSTFEKLREIRNDPRILIALGLIKIVGPLSVMKQAEKTANWIQVDKVFYCNTSVDMHPYKLAIFIGENHIQ